MVEFEECGAEQPFDYESEIHLLSDNQRIAISLRVSGEFARMITANFIGIEEYQVSEDDLEKHSLKELANMVGGGYHAHINDPAWQLGLPRVWKIEDEGVNTTPVPDGLGFAFFGESAGSAVVNYLPGCAAALEFTNWKSPGRSQ